MATTTYICDGCGKEFGSRVKRPEGRYCAVCVGILRKAGLGPRQAPDRTKEQITQVLEAAWRRVNAKRPKLQSDAGSVPEEIVELTLSEFISQVPVHHSEYHRKNSEVRSLETRIQSKCHTQGYLDPEDIEAVVLWGSRKFGKFLWTRINSKKDATESIRHHTAEAIKVLPDAEEALKHITHIFGLGVAFGSKVVAFLYPQSAPVLDRVINDCLSKASNWRGRYEDFIILCEHIVSRQQIGSGPRDGVWYLRDVEMALFEFAWREEGKPKTYIVGGLPIGR